MFDLKSGGSFSNGFPVLQDHSVYLGSHPYISEDLYNPVYEEISHGELVNLSRQHRGVYPQFLNFVLKWRSLVLIKSARQEIKSNEEVSQYYGIK